MCVEIMIARIFRRPETMIKKNASVPYQNTCLTTLFA